MGANVTKVPLNCPRPKYGTKTPNLGFKKNKNAVLFPEGNMREQVAHNGHAIAQPNEPQVDAHIQW